LFQEFSWTKNHPPYTFNSIEKILNNEIVRWRMRERRGKGERDWLSWVPPGALYK